MTLTELQVKQMLPTNKDFREWTTLLNLWLPVYGITTKERIACFVGQCAHESVDFTKLSENLNYSAMGLRKVFPKYFVTDQQANLYARKPEMIANKVYANRMGNLGEHSGDGWKYRGRGILQITGKNNYNAFSLECDKTLAETVEYLGTKEGALHSALWFWKVNGLNVFCDKMDIVTLSKRINGGSIGMESRIKEIQRNIKILS